MVLQAQLTGTSWVTLAILAAISFLSYMDRILSLPAQGYTEIESFWVDASVYFQGFRTNWFCVDCDYHLYIVKETCKLLDNIC